MPFVHTIGTSRQLNMLRTPSGTSDDRASTTAQQGSIGTQACRGNQNPHMDEHFEGRKEERMKNDLPGVGTQFEKQN